MDYPPSPGMFRPEFSDFQPDGAGQGLAYSAADIYRMQNTPSAGFPGYAGLGYGPGYGYPGVAATDSEDVPSWAPSFPGYGMPPPGFMPPPYGLADLEPRRGADGATIVPELPQRPSGAYQLDPKIAAVEVLAPDAVRTALERYDSRGLESATVRSIIDPRAALYEERQPRPRHDAVRNVSSRAAAAAEDDLARARALARRQYVAQSSEEEYKKAQAAVQPALDRAKKLQDTAELLISRNVREDRRSIRSAMGSTLRADPVQKVVAKWAA